MRFWHLNDMERLRLHPETHLSSSYPVILGAGLMVLLRQVRHGQMDLRYCWDMLDRVTWKDGLKLRPMALRPCYSSQL